MEDIQIVKTQLAYLEIYRQNLSFALQQVAQQGGSIVADVRLLNTIEESRSNIHRIKQNLRTFNYAVPDLPDDEGSFIPTEIIPTEIAFEHVHRGLKALSDLIDRLAHNVTVYEAIAVYRLNFEEYGNQIALLGDYKMLHDLFQQLEAQYNVLVAQSHRLPDDLNAWEMIEVIEPSLFIMSDKILALVEQAKFVEETSIWTRLLRRTQSGIRTALETYNADQLKQMVMRLKPLIVGQLDWADSSLKEAAKGLRLSTLVRALQLIHDHMQSIANTLQDPVATQQVTELGQGVEALNVLDEKLSCSITLHTKFQHFDDHLRRVADLILQNVNELITSWQDITFVMDVLCEDNDAVWTLKLKSLSEEVAQSISTNEVLKIRRAFMRYRSQAIESFNQVDYDLLQLCGKLQYIDEPIEAVLRMIRNHPQKL